MGSARERFDPSLVIIWVIALFTVVCGSLWSSHDFKLSLKRMHGESCTLNNDNPGYAAITEQQQQQQQQTDVEANENENNNAQQVIINETITEPTTQQINKNQEKSTKNKESSDHQAPLISVTFVGIIVLLVFVITILLLLYFFYKYMSKKSYFETLKRVYFLYN